MHDEVSQGPADPFVEASKPLGQKLRELAEWDHDAAARIQRAVFVLNDALIDLPDDIDGRVAVELVEAVAGLYVGYEQMARRVYAREVEKKRGRL